MVTIDYDVAVVGGGPAGLSVARKCAKNGLKVVVFEEDPVIGEPLACGEGISINKLQELGIPFEEKTSANMKKVSAFVEQFVKLQRFYFGQGGVAISQLDTVTIDRPKFDRYLATAATANGSEVMTGQSVRDLVFESDKVILSVKHQDGEIDNFFASVVVAADGPVARMSKKAGLQPPAEYVQGLEKKIEGVHTDALEFFFDFDLLPGGYGWIFPKKNDTNIGIVVKPALKPRERLEKFVNRVIGQKEDIIEKRLIAGIIPASGPVNKPYRERFLVIGDAGGFTNTLFYGGIAIGIHTGYLAAQVIKLAFNRDDFSERMFSNYSQLLDNMDYTNPIIQDAHDLMYNRFNNEDLEKAGKVINGSDITHLGKLGKVRLGFKTISSPMRKNLKDLRLIMKGFKHSRDWGF
ncbi:MAG: NAD(P)/FAD-dependent oxidoreductase [Candidatus Hodarchaeales archaeon]|jgi:digeranylgeranylglycerophospholipid reductase